MKKTDLLRELQAVDTALDQACLDLEQRRTGLGDDSELAPLLCEREAAGQRLQSLQERGLELDTELEAATAKRKAEEQKLYEGKIKNPKELASLAQEVELERKRVSRLEDRALMNMDELEEASKAAESADRACREMEAAWREAQSLLERECADLAAQVEELSRRRGEIVARVDPGTLRTYESLRRSRGGLAVAAVEQRACQGCRISLSSSEVQRARSSLDLVFCQSCGRILYVPG